MQSNEHHVPGSALAELLKLPFVIGEEGEPGALFLNSYQVTVKANEVVVIDARYEALQTIDSDGKFASVMKRYELKEIQ